MKKLSRTVLWSACLWGAVSCGGGQTPGTGDLAIDTPQEASDAMAQLASIAESCRELEAKVAKARAGTVKDLDAAIASAAGVSGVDKLQTSAARLKALAPAKFCADLEAGSANLSAAAPGFQCLERRLSGLQALGTLFANAPGKPDQLAWHVGGKLAYLEETQACLGRAKSTPDAFMAEKAGDKGIVTRGGIVDGGALRLDLGGDAFVSKRLTLDAALICQRRDGDGFADVDNCDGAELTEGDRFKVRFSVDTTAYLYFYLFNDKGQLQMFFPAADVPNKAPGGTAFFLPPRDGWITLDNVSNVYEHIHLAASTYPIAELEALRGTNITAETEPGVRSEADKIRGKIEPIITRGNPSYDTANIPTRGKIEPVITRGKIEPVITRGKIEPIITRGGKLPGTPVTLVEAGAKRVATPVIVETDDIAIVEFEFFHR